MDANCADPTTVEAHHRGLKGLKICFVAGTLGQGGAERQLMHLLKALCHAGSEVRVACLTRGELHEASIRELGLPIVGLGEDPSRFKRLFQLTRELKDSRPNVVHSQHFFTNAYAALAGRLARVPHVGALRSTGIDEVRTTGYVLGRTCLHLPRILAANTRAALDYARTEGIAPHRLHWLGNVVDTDLFKPIQRPVRTPVRIGAVGRMTREKRFDRFLRCVARISDRAKGRLDAVIAGEGPLRTPLESLAQELGLASRVRFLGATTDMTGFYASVDALVLTSDWEGSPNVVMEAMATGLPVVATRVGGVPELVRDGETGFLVDPADEELLATRVREVVESPLLRTRLGTAGAAWVRQHCSPQGLPLSLSQLYAKARA